jgi:hypothetical protein
MWPKPDIILYGSFRPKPVSGQYWERLSAADAGNLEAAVRNAQTIFAPGTSGSEFIAASCYVLLSFGTGPEAVTHLYSPIQTLALTDEESPTDTHCKTGHFTCSRLT